MNQPMALHAFKVPGTRTSFPSASLIIFPVIGFPSRKTLPASLISKATEFANRTDFVFRFTLYAIKKSRAPITVPPAFSLNSVGPKSGTHSRCFIFLKKPSYSPALITERLLRSLLGCAFSYK